MIANTVADIVHGDCLRELAWLDADVLITDPPYGIDYNTGQAVHGASSIEGDKDISLRERVLALWGDRPALVFGSWKRPKPEGTKMLLVWDSKGALGMGDLSLPWKPAHQEIYVLGSGFVGRRTSDVLRVAPTQAVGRLHPHQKPVPLMEELIAKCPSEWKIADPFAGSGSTLVAAALLGRDAIGVEIDDTYVQRAKIRLEQRVLIAVPD